jgi:integrase
LKAAGIPQQGVDGCSLDVHCFRHTFGTMLALAGVPPATLKQLMRHKKIDTTMRYYIHIKATDAAEALKKLPEL